MDEHKNIDIDIQNEAAAENEKDIYIAEGHKVVDERMIVDADRMEEQRRMNSMHVDEMQHEDEFRHEEQKKADEQRCSEMRRKEEKKSKYPHGLRNGNDLVTMTARLICDVGRAAKEDVSGMKDKISAIKESHEETIDNRAARNEFYRQDMQDTDRIIQRQYSAGTQKAEPQEKARQQDGRAEKESPALARCSEHERSLNAKVDAHIKSLHDNNNHDVLRDR